MIMKTYHCKKCGCDLSAKEVKYMMDEGMMPDTFICDECFLLQENNNPEPDEFSDADPGL